MSAFGPKQTWPAATRLSALAASPQPRRLTSVLKNVMAIIVLWTESHQVLPKRLGCSRSFYDPIALER